MATRASTAALCPIGQRSSSQSSAAPRVTRLARQKKRTRAQSKKVQELSRRRSEANMKMGYEKRNMRSGLKRTIGIGVAGMLAGAMTLAPPAAASSVGKEERIVNERGINRAEVENLQRWVSSGHADWCKDARLVAAEELWRLAPEYSGDGLELNAISGETNAAGGDRGTFEWAWMAGRAAYRGTLERFDWLLPIASDTEAIVWVPTSTEIRTHE